LALSARTGPLAFWPTRLPGPTSPDPVDPRGIFTDSDVDWAYSITHPSVVGGCNSVIGGFVLDDVPTDQARLAMATGYPKAGLLGRRRLADLVDLSLAKWGTPTPKRRVVGLTDRCDKADEAE